MFKKTLTGSEIQGHEFLMLMFKEWGRRIASHLPVSIQRLDISRHDHYINTSRVPIPCIDYAGIVLMGKVPVRFGFSFYEGQLKSTGYNAWMWNTHVAPKRAVVLHLEDKTATGNLNYVTFQFNPATAEWSVSDMNDKMAEVLSLAIKRHPLNRDFF